MPDEKMMFCLLVSSALMYGCQSRPVHVSTTYPVVDIPALMMEKQEPNLTQRLLNVFSLSDGTETPPSGT